MAGPFFVRWGQLRGNSEHLPQADEAGRVPTPIPVEIQSRPVVKISQELKPFQLHAPAPLNDCMEQPRTGPLPPQVLPDDHVLNQPDPSPFGSGHKRLDRCHTDDLNPLHCDSDKRRARGISDQHAYAVRLFFNVGSEIGFEDEQVFEETAEPWNIGRQGLSDDNVVVHWGGWVTLSGSS